MGRKKLDDKEKRSERVVVRLTEDEKELLNKLGMSMSSYMRTVLRSQDMIQSINEKLVFEDLGNGYYSINAVITEDEKNLMYLFHEISKIRKKD